MKFMRALLTGSLQLREGLEWQSHPPASEHAREEGC